jgi:hypothetical protein
VRMNVKTYKGFFVVELFVLMISSDNKCFVRDLRLYEEYDFVGYYSV